MILKSSCFPNMVQSIQKFISKNLCLISKISVTKILCGMRCEKCFKSKQVDKGLLCKFKMIEFNLFTCMLELCGQKLSLIACTTELPKELFVCSGILKLHRPTWIKNDLIEMRSNQKKT